ncbi:hypothetical protein [Brevibacillus dissolubilis]|uniref:hypothetical protein n=1 Tax=Brevibacillus dissolubilis TaxID=1844116 RepID=UPI001117A717|nr:hypothetical protein [Brevibacillus dissolubilis]
MPRKQRQEEEAMQKQTEAPKQNAQAADEPTYTLDSLRRSSQNLFGVPVEVFDGAVYGMAQKRLSKSEARALIQQFLTREV